MEKLQKCVISYKWILKCVNQKKLVELSPDMLIHSNEKLDSYFSQNLDMYGDHYSAPVDMERLSIILENMSLGPLERQTEVKASFTGFLGLERSSRVFEGYVIWFPHFMRYLDYNDHETNLLVLKI